MTWPLSRRSFFHSLTAGATAAATGPPAPPREAWILLAQGWEYNDECSYPEGEYARDELYYDRAAAEAECQRLCADFFAAQTPVEFEVDWTSYDLDRGADFDPASVTWDELRVAGFPEPYSVQRLTVPGAEPS
jgi:hypothetical protein